MPVINILYYPSLEEMPPYVRNQVRTMGYVDGTLRQVANDLLFGNKGAMVVFVDDYPIGWSVCYFNKKIPDKYELGFWIRQKYRNKGYGLKLIVESYKTWRTLHPKVFDKVIPIWQSIDNKLISNYINRNNIDDLLII